MKTRLCIVLDPALLAAAHKLMELDCFTGFSAFVEDLLRRQAKERGIIGVVPPPDAPKKKR